MVIFWLLPVALLVFVAAYFFALRTRHATNWQWDYWRQKLARERPSADEPIHVIFAFVDHFEPMWRRPDRATEDRRVDAWCEQYRAMASRHRDADGAHPKHTFFYPEEEYRVEHLAKIADLCGEGFGELEVHLHHENDTDAGLREKLDRFCRLLRDKHGALSTWPNSDQLAWGFIHGNWTLDNSAPDGSWCGVNNEIQVLADCGCYADFTLPSAPSPTQTRKVNSIYYATDDPEKPKSHDTGTDVHVGGQLEGDLMMIQGILGWDWSSRKFGVIPRIENSDIRAAQPPTRARVDNWIRTAVAVRGQPNWRFVKVHTHGTQEPDMPVLLGQPTEDMFSYLETQYNDGSRYKLHYVSAREMFNIAKAAEAGEKGDAGKYRDFVLPQPPGISRNQS